jgi:hypothetical protein
MFLRTVPLSRTVPDTPCAILRVWRGEGVRGWVGRGGRGQKGVAGKDGANKMGDGLPRHPSPCQEACCARNEREGASCEISR